MSLALLGHVCAESRRNSHMLQSQPVLLSIFQLDDLKQEMTSDVSIVKALSRPASKLTLLALGPEHSHS